MERVLEPEYMDTDEEADGYDAMDHSGPNQSFLDRLLELKAGGYVLDIGTGPGHLPLMVCEAVEGARVLGVDAASKMIAIAERHRLASKHADRIEYRIGDAKGLDFGDDTFDTVYSNTILHHIPDPVPFLREAYRVLRPGGALLIRDLFRPDSPDEVAKLVDQHAEGANPYQRELFRASLCAAFRPDELVELAKTAGLQGHEVIVDTDRHMSLQIPRTP